MGTLEPVFGNIGHPKTKNFRSQQVLSISLQTCDSLRLEPGVLHSFVRREKRRMRTFTYWIQHADFTTTTGYPVSTEQAIQTFANCDWDAQMLAANSMWEAGAKHVCEPGIGFHPVETYTDLLLDIRPLSWDKAKVGYLYPEYRKRLFGLIPRLPVLRTVTRAGLPMEDVREAITLFMADRHSDLLRLLRNDHIIRNPLAGPLN